MNYNSNVRGVLLVFTIAGILLLVASCAPKKSEVYTLKQRYSQPVETWEAPWIDAGISWKELGTLKPLEVELDSGEVALGKRLFFDKRLSRNKRISCASCHDPKLAWQDGLEKSPGHDSLLGDRNTQSILNIAHFQTFFWDGRAKTLEEQVEGPLTNSKEMNNDIESLLKTLNGFEEYRTLFKEVYNADQVTSDKLFQAIATYERTLWSANTRFDKFIQGDTTAMNASEIRGLHLFRTKGRCMNCHNGPLFSDGDFHNLGLVYYGRKYEDLGRYHVTKKAADVGRFRTPTLRNVMNTGPWMHNGFVWEMEGVMSMYNAGMVQLSPTETQAKDSLFPKTSELLKPLGLTYGEQQELIAFLKCLSTIEQPQEN